MGGFISPLRSIYLYKDYNSVYVCMFAGRVKCARVTKIHGHRTYACVTVVPHLYWPLQLYVYVTIKLYGICKHSLL